MNGKWTHENFLIFHQEHPEIYQMFCRFSIQMAQFKDHYSARGIFHRIRWETSISEEGGIFKLDAGWSSHYARMFMEDHPQYEEFFSTRIRQHSYHTE